MKRKNTNRWGMILMIAGLIGSWSCGKDDPLELFVDSTLQEYFDRFAAEGALRGVPVDFVASRISGFKRIITQPGVIGQCAHSTEEPNTVIIDKIYWDTADDLEREFVVFHELGHCVLNREHLDNSDSHGDCVSMMTSGTGLCHINYTTATRSKLLDELFNP